MSHELHYTSAPRGLKPGSRGFATVAATRNLPERLAERLESLSGYQAVYPPGDPSEILNPVVLSHVRLSFGGRMLHVLSRNGPAGLDYSGRPNKYAHHVVLEPEELPEGGPAWLLSQPDFLEAVWTGEPRTLTEGRAPPVGDRPAGVARAWQALTGDAGWAGVVAESFLADPRRPVFLVFQAGVDVLPLFAEAIALLPASRRWDVELSTYFTTLPQGITCAWRAVLEDSPEAKSARRLPGALVLDLSRPAGCALEGPLVHLARTGERIDSQQPELPAPAREPASIRASEPPVLVALPPVPGGAPSTHPQRAQPSAWSQPATEGAGGIAPSPSAHSGRWRRGPAMTILPLAAAGCLVVLIAAALLPIAGIQRGPGSESRATFTPAAPAGRGTQVEDVTAGPRSAQPEGVVKDEAHITDAPLAKLAPRPAIGSLRDAAGGLPAATTRASPAAPPGAALGATAVSKYAPASASSTPADGTSDDVLSRPGAPDSSRGKVGPRGNMAPLLFDFALPAIPRSQLASSQRQRAELILPCETTDRVEILNAPGFRIIPPTPGGPLQIAAQPRSSRLAGNPTLAQINRKGEYIWTYSWTSDAKIHSTLVEGMKDAILRFEASDGRAIFVLLRPFLLQDDRPLVIEDKQPLLGSRIEPKARSIEWARDRESLEGTRWKLSIRRWRMVITRSDPENAEPQRRAFEPPPVKHGQKKDGSPAAGPQLGCDLVPGEVSLELALDPARPAIIIVRINPDRDAVKKGRARRASRLTELQAGREEDPVDYRRGRLRELEVSGAGNDEEKKIVEGEIRELEAIAGIRQVEDLLAKPVRAELSVVIGLDVGGASMLDIVKIGEFADSTDARHPLPVDSPIKKRPAGGNSNDRLPSDR
jgi:hypothetical protein